jgi:HPt (histidine-containing phosphotransfer) domain-containing protein
MDNWHDRPEFDGATVCALKNAVGDDAFAVMKVQFREDLERLRTAFLEARDNADPTATKETAHALKGAASNIGLMRLGALVGGFETDPSADSGDFVATFDSAIEHLMKEA